MVRRLARRKEPSSIQRRIAGNLAPSLAVAGGELVNARLIGGQTTTAQRRERLFYAQQLIESRTAAVWMRREELSESLLRDRQLTLKAQPGIAQLVSRLADPGRRQAKLSGDGRRCFSGGQRLCDAALLVT